MSPQPIALPVEGLSDGEIRLRLASDADAETLAGAAADPAIARGMIRSPAAAVRTRAWIGWGRRGVEAGTDLQTLIVAEPAGELLGSVSLSGIDPASSRCAAGYWLLPAARGRGIATRALRLLCAYAFEHLGVRRIEVWIEPRNAASARVAERAGFRRRGVVRARASGERSTRQLLLYARLPPRTADRQPASG